MHTCYESLGEFVQNLRTEEADPLEIKVDYYFQTVSLAALLPLVTFFSNLNIKSRDYDERYSQMFKRKQDLPNIANKIKAGISEDSRFKTMSECNVFVVFSKKGVEVSLTQLMKKDLQTSVEFFRQRESINPLDVNNLEPVFSLRSNIIEKLNKSDLKLAELLCQYMRNIDLNYIEATKSYFKEKLTLRTLLQRDQMNKKFTKMKQIKLGLDNNSPSYSCDPAADYILSKMDEMKEDVILTSQDQTVNFSRGSAFSMERVVVSPFKPFILPNKDEVHRGLELILNNARPESFGNMDLDLNFEEEHIGRFKFYLGLINCETKIRKKYFQGLLLCLARSRAQYENRYIKTFEITICFGISILEKNTAYIFIEKQFMGIKDFGIRIEEEEGRIEVVDMWKEKEEYEKRTSLSAGVATVKSKLVGEDDEGRLDLEGHERERDGGGEEGAGNPHVRRCAHVLERLQRDKRLYDFRSR